MSNAEIFEPKTSIPAPATTAEALGETALAKVLYLPGHEPLEKELFTPVWITSTESIFEFLHIDFMPKIPIVGKPPVR